MAKHQTTKERENTTSKPTPPQPHNKSVEEERDEYLAGWKRALADYENLKRDVMKERDLMRATVTEAVATAYLPIYDHLMAATQNTPDIPEAKQWFEGVGHIAQQCKETLAQFGVESIEAKGKQFNPEHHEAVGTEYDAGKQEDAVLRETQTGFTLRGKVIRPSKVIVNKSNKE